MPELLLRPVADGDLMECTVTPPGMPVYLTVQDFDGIDDNTLFKTTITGQTVLVKTEPAPDEHLGSGVITYVGGVIRAKRYALSQVEPIKFAFTVHSGAVEALGTVVILNSASLNWRTFDGRTDARFRMKHDPATGGAWTMQSGLAAQVGITDISGMGEFGGAHALDFSYVRKVLSFGAVASRGAVRR